MSIGMRCIYKPVYWHKSKKERKKNTLLYHYITLHVKYHIQYNMLLGSTDRKTGCFFGSLKITPHSHLVVPSKEHPLADTWLHFACIISEDKYIAGICAVTSCMYTERVNFLYIHTRHYSTVTADTNVARSHIEWDTAFKKQTNKQTNKPQNCLHALTVFAFNISSTAG